MGRLNQGAAVLDSHNRSSGAGTGSIVIVILTVLGVEAKGAVLGTARGRGAADPKTLASAALSLN